MNNLGHILIAVLLLVTFNITSQNLSPTEQQALLYITIVDNIGKPVSQSLTVQSQKTKKVFSVKSNAKGIAELLLPINDSYALSLPNQPNIDLLDIPATPYFTFNYQLEIQQQISQNCTLELVVTDIAKKSMANEYIAVTDRKTNIKQTAVTDSKGCATFKVIPGSSQTLEFMNAPNYDIINIPDIKNGIYTYKSIFQGSALKMHPSLTHGLVDFYYYNLDSVPLQGEQFTFVAANDNKKYTASSNTKGLAQILLPVGDKYSVNTNSRNSIITFSVPNDSGRIIIEHVHYFYSSADFKLKQKEIDRQAAIRDSIFELRLINDAERSQYYRDYFELETIERNVFLLNETNEMLKSRFERKAIHTRKQLSNDSLFFKKTQRTILSTVYRFKDKWMDKVFVVDFTCSMDPYMDELLLWCQLNMVNGENKKYLFFNDGDNITRIEEKILGKTGGFHYVLDNSLENINNTLLTTRSLSPACSVDAPENNVEALIDAQKLLGKNSQLILIADNYAPVRDIELINQVKHPVRVIVCGVIGTINEDLLEIAVKTKGSIHTLEEDIMNLSNLKNLDEVTIGSNVYRYLDGRLFWKRSILRNYKSNDSL